MCWGGGRVLGRVSQRWSDICQLVQLVKPQVDAVPIQNGWGSPQEPSQLPEGAKGTHAEDRSTGTTKATPKLRNSDFEQSESRGHDLRRGGSPVVPTRLRAESASADMTDKASKRTAASQLWNSTE